MSVYYGANNAREQGEDASGLRELPLPGGGGFFVGVLGVSPWVARGSSFLSAFEVLLLWSVQRRFAGGSCFAASSDVFECVRVRFPSTEDILEQCGLCCVLS